MLYNVHVFIGEEFTKSVENVGNLLVQSGGEVVEHANLYLVGGASSGSFRVSKLNVYDQVLNEARNIQSTHLGWTDISYSEGNNWSSVFERSIYREILNVNRAMQGFLPVYFHFPLYKNESISTLENLCKGIINSTLPADITFIGYGDDMAPVIEPGIEVKSQCASNVSLFEKLRGMSGMSRERNRFVFIQNSNASGIPLGIDEEEAFAVMLEQLMIIFPTYADKIFPLEPHDVIGLGFASLSFDKFKFSKYLLQRGIMQTIDNSSINVANVDINDVFARLNQLFANRDKFLSAFIDENKNLNADEDFQNQLFKSLKAKIEQIKTDLEKIFVCESSIPFKAALLAALLSKTENELFSSSVYNQSNLSYLDLYKESIDHFIENDEAEFYQIKGEKVFNPISRISEINRKLINSEEQIRTLEKRLHESETNIENSNNVEKCLKDNGIFQFEDYKFRLIPNVVEELKLETYEPKPVSTSSVDLRPYFSSIKNQGSQGSCTSHAIVSIFEFIMKVNQAEDCDLSEAFLFYNARKIGNLINSGDTGSSIQHSLDSLAQYGISLEKFCPYNPNVYDVEPSKEAYEDASTRKLLKALIVNRKSDDIRSALAEGYPVAGSFKLTESFGKDPYMEMPSEEEITKSYDDSDSSHAMVIVGFNDALQMFLVRNSWGTSFGINGYCYIPYDYVNHPKLFNCAFIMTEVASLKKSIPDLKEIKALKVDSTDSKIRYIVNKAALTLENQVAQKLRAEKDDLQEYLETIRTSFASANNRDSYVAANKAKLNDDKVQLEHKISDCQEKQEILKKEFESYRKKTLITAVVTIIGLLALWLSLNICFDKFLNSLLETNIHLDYIYYAILSGLIFVLAIIAVYIKKRTWIEDRDALENRIVKAKKDINVINNKIKFLSFKSFAAWTIIRKLEDINEYFFNMYTKMISLINNLREWYGEVKECNSSMPLDTCPLEISLIDKDILDNYFVNQLRTSNVFNIDLTEGLENYEITSEFLSDFKERLISCIHGRLIDILKEREFNISAHLSGHEYDNIAKQVSPAMISSLKYKSGIFMRLNLVERGYVASNTFALAPDLQRYCTNLQTKFNNCEIQDIFETDDRNRIMFITSSSYKYDECVMLKK